MGFAFEIFVYWGSLILTELSKTGQGIYCCERDGLLVLRFMGENWGNCRGFRTLFLTLSIEKKERANDSN